MAGRPTLSGVQWLDSPVSESGSLNRASLTTQARYGRTTYLGDRCAPDGAIESTTRAAGRPTLSEVRRLDSPDFESGSLSRASLTTQAGHGRTTCPGDRCAPDGAIESPTRAIGRPPHSGALRLDSLVSLSGSLSRASLPTPSVHGRMASARVADLTNTLRLRLNPSWFTREARTIQDPPPRPSAKPKA